MELLIRLAVLVGGGWLLWKFWRMGRPRGEFVVKIHQGQPKATSGIVTPGFLQVVREVAADHKMKSGRVMGVGQGKGTGIRLEFSRDFSSPARQRLRNWWVADGWRTSFRPNPSRRA